MPLLLLTLTLFLTACSHLQAVDRVPSVIAPADYGLSFHDDFKTLDLSLDGRGDHKWYNDLWLEDPLPLAGEINKEGSVLHLRWRRNPNAPKKWTTSVTSMSRDFKHGHAWEFGYFEVEARFNPVAGSWPAIWLVAPSLATDGAAAVGCEIDIFEAQSSLPQTFVGTVHEWERGQNRQNATNSKVVSADFSHFHRYGLLWTAERINWYMDDDLVLSEPTPPLCTKGSLYLILGSQEGVNWQYGNRTGVGEQTELDVDVKGVRVWQRRKTSTGAWD